MLRRLTLGLAALAMAALAMAASSAAAAVPVEVLEAEARRVEVVAQVRPSVVAIFSSDGGGGGSGVLISPDGYCLTNYHVTQGAGVAMKCGLDDGVLYDAVLVGVDMTGDVALVRLLGRDDFPYSPMGDSNGVRVGDFTFAMGNPFLLAMDFTPTVTYGMVSGIHRYQYPAGTLLEYTDCIQFDTSINPGNSGGPLFNDEGEVIGINGRGSFEKRGRVNVGVGYAISINQIQNFLGCLESGRYVDHATLGATVNTTDDGRVVVSDILTSSDAYRRGLRYGDEIVSFGGRRIDTANTFKNVLGIFPRHFRVPLVYRRDGKDTAVLVRLAGVHREGELAELDAGSQQPEGMPLPMEVPKAKEMPEIVEKHYEQRSGFANYHFNRFHQERVFGLLRTHGDFSSSDGLWKILGTDSSGGPFELRTDGNLISFVLSFGETAFALPEDLTTERRPAGSGGLAAALLCWRQLFVAGPEGFDNVLYLGRLPLHGHNEGLVDVVVAEWRGLEARFYVSPDSGLLLAVETFPGESVDPCEIYFAAYRDEAGLQLPGVIEVRYGDEIFGTFTVDSYQLTAAPETP